MTRENKELLLRDLCARLTYGVKVDFHGKVETLCEAHIYPNVQTLVGESGILYDAELVKPYLRPMSSMTEEERDYLKVHINDDFVDYCNEHHLDDRCLISMNLALEAPEGMYKTE